MIRIFILACLLYFPGILLSQSINKKYWDDPQAHAFVDSLIELMTLEEKIGQLTLFTSGWDVTGPSLKEDYVEDVKKGRVGNIFNALTTEYTRKLQKMAVEETRLKIPLLFGYDVIHGYKTIFPIPLAESCSWDLEMIKKTAQLSAKEAAAAGLHWTFNPMVDIARDPRWGRIAEGSGEDTYLGSLIAKAKVMGYQGEDWRDPKTVLACVKHFAAYGAAQAGRDYHTVDMSERVLREVYLPPYQAAIDAGAATVMTSFNEIDGVPATGSEFLLTQILRKEWGFEGFVVTDYTSINEMVPHGIVANEKEAAELAFQAGVDMDMQGAVYYSHLKKLVEENKLEEKHIDQKVKHILLAKYQLGLFENPYRYADADREKATVLSQEMKNHSLEMARRSIVLLKNEAVKGKPLLPLAKDFANIALIGPLADNQVDMLGTWHAAGDEPSVVTVLEGLKKGFPQSNVQHAKGCDFTGDDKSGFSEALEIAQKSDLVIMAVGENYLQSGEAASRSNLDLPGLQLELIQEIQKLGKPMVIVVLAGRPLTIPWLAENTSTIVYAWHLGTMGGTAIADVLTGAYNPSAKLTITFPRNVGQVPIFYSMKNTGRPFNAQNKYTSKYLDTPNEPLYPFGYGLSYANFEYGRIQLNKKSIGFEETLEVEIEVINRGDVAGEEIVQLYVQDLVGSVTRPVKELKGFQKVLFDAGERKTITFQLNARDLAFYTRNMEFKAEPGDFKVFIGTNSADTQEATFKLIEK